MNGVPTTCSYCALFLALACISEQNTKILACLFYQFSNFTIFYNLTIKLTLWRFHLCSCSLLVAHKVTASCRCWTSGAVAVMGEMRVFHADRVTGLWPSSCNQEPWLFWHRYADKCNTPSPPEMAPVLIRGESRWLFSFQSSLVFPASTSHFHFASVILN